MPSAAEMIAALQLAPLPHEGGFFRVTWRSEASSAILFLITPDNFSALHRLAQEEAWHFHAGDPVEHVQLDSRTGGLRRTRLGSAVLAGEMPQLVVPAGVWQGARIGVGQVCDLTALPVDDHPAERVKDPTYFGWSLLGCTLAPPWDEHGFELGSRTALRAAFLAHAPIIDALTR